MGMSNLAADRLAVQSFSEQEGVMEEVKIFVELPHEVEKWLIQNKTSLERLLRQQGVEVRERHELNPFRQEDGNATERDFGLALIVTGVVTAAITALGIVADNILKTMNKKTLPMTARRLTVVRNAKGDPVFDKEGEPLYELEETPVLLEPRAENSTMGFQVQWNDPQEGKVFQVDIGAPHKEMK